MDNQLRGLLLGLAVVFVVFFLGLTLAALPSAEPNFASIVTFGLSFLILGTLGFMMAMELQWCTDPDSLWGPRATLPLVILLLLIWLFG